MAKFTPGIAIGSASGSVGGTVFSRNRYGVYMRTKGVPVDVASPMQLMVRAAITAASAKWRDLSDIERASWKTYAQENPIMDALGQSQVLAPNAAFVQLNSRISLFGGTIIQTPPLIAAPDPLTSIGLEVDLGAGDVELNFAPSPVPADHVYVVRACVVNSPGRTYLKNLWRIISPLAAAEASPWADLKDELENVFGTLVNDQIVHVSVSVLSLLTGLYSSPVLDDATVETSV